MNFIARGWARLVALAESTAEQRVLARAMGLLEVKDGHVHLHCATCRYDLFGLPADVGCPECGTPVLATAMKTALTVSEDVEGDPTEHPTRRPFRFVTETFGYPVDAFLFVRDALRQALGQVAADRPVVHVDARVLCERVRRFAVEHFGSEAEARAVFGDWNIRRSEDVGRIVYAMVRSGVMRTQPGDAQEQFDGLFTIEDWAAER